MPDLQGSESLNVMFRIFTSFFVFRYRNEASEKWQKEADHERTSENGTFSSQIPEDIQKQYLEIVDQIKDGSFVEE